MTQVEIADPTLLERARTGDAVAFARLVEQHRSLLWSVCYRITLNQHDAEDALQDGLLAAWHHLASFRGEAALSTWLYRIAANAALAVARRRVPEPVEMVPEEPGYDLADAVVDRDLVQVALRTLPPDFREAVVLRELCDFTYDQIAAHQQVSVQTVKSRLNRGRSRLRAELQVAGRGV